MFAVSIAFVCFYDAEHILSAIAKFLVHLLGEGKGWGAMEEGREEKTVGRKRKGMEGKEMGIHEQIAPKCNIFGRLGGYRPVSYIFGKLFSGQHCYHR